MHVPLLINFLTGVVESQDHAMLAKFEIDETRSRAAELESLIFQTKIFFRKCSFSTIRTLFVLLMNITPAGSHVSLLVTNLVWWCLIAYHLVNII